MKKILILFSMVVMLVGCKPISQGMIEPPATKINARVLVYLSDEFVNYQYSYSAVLSRYDYVFKDSINTEVPPLFKELFISADIVYKAPEITDAYDFVVVPEFVSANLFSDRIFGNDLLIYIKATFTSKNPLKTLALEGVGRSSDDKVYAETRGLGEKAFNNALQDLKKHILENRSALEAR